MVDSSILITAITVIDNYNNFVNGFFLSLKYLLEERLVKEIIIINNACEDIRIKQLFADLDHLKKIYTDSLITKQKLENIKYELCNQSKTIHIFYFDQNLRLDNTFILIERYIVWELKRQNKVFSLKTLEDNKGCFYEKTIVKDNYFSAVNKKTILENAKDYAENFLNIETNKFFNLIKLCQKFYGL